MNQDRPRYPFSVFSRLPLKLYHLSPRINRCTGEITNKFHGFMYKRGETRFRNDFSKRSGREGVYIYPVPSCGGWNKDGRLTRERIARGRPHDETKRKRDDSNRASLRGGRGSAQCVPGRDSTIPPPLSIGIHPCLDRTSLVVVVVVVVTTDCGLTSAV